MDRSTAINLGAHLAANAGVRKEGGLLGFKAWGELSGGVRSSLEKSGVTRDSYSKAIEASSSDRLEGAVSELSRASREFSADETNSLDTSADNTMRTTIDDLKRRSRSSENFERASDTYSEAADRVETEVVDMRQDLSGAFADFIMSKGYSESQTADMLNQRGDPSDVQRLRNDFAQQYIEDIVQPEMSERFGTELPMPLNPGSAGEAEKPYNYMSGKPMSDLAAGQLETQMGIIKQRNAINRPDNGQSVKDEAFNRATNYDQAKDESWSHSLSSKLIKIPNGVAWQSGDIGSGVDANGFYQAPNVSYGFGSTTIRNEPVDPTLMRSVSRYANQLGNNIGVVVVSGGQPRQGRRRTGSHRHDHGNAVDFHLTRDGRRVTPEQDPQLYERMIELSAQDHAGIGHYGWGLHVGGGNPAFWGPDKSSKSADPQFAAAYQRGRSSQ